MQKSGWFWSAGGLNSVHIGLRLRLWCAGSHLSRWTANGARTLWLRGPRSLSATNWWPDVEPPCIFHIFHIHIFQSYVGPQQKVQPAVDEICLSRAPRGSACSSQEASIHFRLQFTARFWVLSMCMCPAQGCCFRRIRGQPFWWASQCLAHCHSPPRSLPFGRHLSVHVQIVACEVSPTSCCVARQSEWSYCRPQSGLQTWHPSYSTADNLLAIQLLSTVPATQ